MKKKFLLVFAVVALLVLALSITASAETVLNSQNDSSFGEISIFDENVTVGRTDAANGFTPFKADGTSYARVVMGDGTTFYTFPSYYIMVKNAYESGNPLFQYDFSSLNSAMEAQTGTNPGWNKTNVYRLELPETMTRLNNAGSQAFDGFSNLIELYIPANSTTVGTNISCLFRDCKNLETFHNVDTFLFKKGCLTDAFKNCAKLTSLTLCYSPDVVETGVNSFYGCTALKSVNFTNAFPNVTKIGNYCFYKCSSLTSLTAGGQEYAFVLQDGITSIGQQAFDSCTSFKYLSLPATVTYMGPACFEICSSLQFVDFNDNQNDVDFNNWGMFYKCTNLKAISIETKSDYITNRFFANCTNLQAVYLPSTTVTIESNGYGDGSAFSYCNNMFFVNEPFEVRDENGLFYGDSFVMPEKPEVYFFPSNLQNIFKRDSGVGFANCYNLNSVMVFPKTLTQLWINDGVFYECGKTGNTFTIVCLGDMTDIRIGFREQRATGVSYILANVNDKTLNDVNITDTSTSYTPTLGGTEHVYFCHSNKYFKMFNISEGNTFTESNVAYIEGVPHLENPKLTVVIDATCTDNEKKTTTCFCGKEIGTSEVENTALGHNFDLSNGASVVDIIYADFTKNGNKVILCGRENCGCHDTEVEGQQLVEVAPVISGFNGYSIKLGGNGITFGFNMNIEALNEYEEYNAKLEIGTVAAVKGYLNGQNPIDAEGNPVALEKGNVIKAQATDKGNIYTRIDFVLKGDIWNSSVVINEETVALKELEFVMCPYVICDGVVSYISTQGSVENANDIVAVYSQLQVEEAPIEE